MVKPMYVYILASKTRRLYVGVTNNLIRRVWEHKNDLVRGFTQRYGVKRLVYFEALDGPEAAIRREKQVKSYARVKKLGLIGSQNPEWNDLSEHWWHGGIPSVARHPERSTSSRA